MSGAAAVYEIPVGYCSSLYTPETAGLVLFIRRMLLTDVN